MANESSPRKYPVFLVVMLVLVAALSVVNLGVNLYGPGRSNRERTTPAAAVPAETPHIAFITGGVDPFWDVTVIGARDAAKRYGAELEVHVPTEGAGDQDKIVRELLTKGVKGIAVSPLDAARQTGLLNQAAAAVNLMTFDSDAPASKRICYVGTNNYLAGWQCGEFVRNLLPDGGRIVISIGSLEKDNGRKRRQGLIDALLDRGYEPNRGMDAATADMAAAKFTILTTLLDNNDAETATTNVGVTLKEFEKIDCIVGLFGYSGPSILEALKQAEKLDQIKVVAFDDHDATLKAIADGHIEGTIVQDAYHFGYVSVEALALLTRENWNPPLSREILYPCFAVTKENLDGYSAERRRLLHTQGS